MTQTERAQGELLAGVALDAAAFSYDRLYTYRIPYDSGTAVQPGMRVLVPFGAGNRLRVGMVLTVSAGEPAAAGERTVSLKPLHDVLDDAPVLTDELMMLVRHLHDTTFCTWYEAVRAVLPGGLQLRLAEQYEPAPVMPDVPLTDEERVLLETVSRTDGSRSALHSLREDPLAQKRLRSLVKKGFLTVVPESRQRIADSTRRMVRLSPEYSAQPEAFRPTPKQRSAVRVLEEYGSLSVRECAYEAGVTELVISNLVKSGIAETYSAEQLRVPRDAKAAVSPADTVLSPQQQAAYDAAAAAVTAEKAAAFLLYGVTGSGKTAVFEQLIYLTVQRGRQALLLIPEISLTPQVVQYFQARFGNQVAMLHSGLSLSQRYDTDKLIRRGEISLVIGTRSAVFAPLPNLGLVILDEEGEHSYKSEQAPRYHAADVAKARCRYHNAVLMLASATPSLESRYLAERGVCQLLRMDQRYNQAPLPEVTVVDMNEERMNGNGSPFSMTLTEALLENLRRGEQSILLLNRRGYHTLLQCTRCYEPVFCPNCSVPLTYHIKNNSLMCHYCGHVQPPVTKCPKCGNDRMRQMGFGTQKLEEELQSLLPGARILRMDADTTMTRTAYETGFQAFAKGEYDILCGTQMIGKGLDFPNVTLVGVVSVDKALFAGDFRSYERTFSLVTQVVGRGGRGVRPGRAILQTFMPDHYVLQLAAQQDYDRFYTEEMAVRRALLYPPVCDICVIGFADAQERNVQKAAAQFTELLKDEIRQKNLKLPLRVLGPVPAGYGRLYGKYRMRLLMKCKNTAEMRTFIRGLLERAYKEKLTQLATVYADMNGDCGV